MVKAVLYVSDMLLFMQSMVVKRMAKSTSKFT